MGCEKQLTVDRESFRNHTMAKIAGQLKGGKENMCKEDVRKAWEAEFNSEIDLPGKRDRSTIYRLNLIKLYRTKPESANLVMENSSEGIDSETLYSEFEPGDASRDLSFVKKGKFCRKEQRGIVGQQIEFVLKWLSRVVSEVGPTKVLSCSVPFSLFSVLGCRFPKACFIEPKAQKTATAGSVVVQSGRPIFDDFFQHLWPYIGNNTANVVFQMVKRLWLIRIDQ
ncbi:uncharacterized protein TNCV_3070141 [Trichonephila clavipes]|nr:uncharacterized protein TNCV_3070141 [Trichonephila clavipes]